MRTNNSTALRCVVYALIAVVAYRVGWLVGYSEGFDDLLRTLETALAVTGRLL